MEIGLGADHLRHRCNCRRRRPCTSRNSSHIWNSGRSVSTQPLGETDMTRYERAVQILDEAIGGPNVNIGVHGAFWRGLSRDQFVAKKIFNRDLVVVGNGSASNLVKALKGEAPFGADLPDPPPGAQFSRMPAGLP